MKNSVEILMSTYNGDKFLSQQIESILRQTYKNWILIIRDDGSVDKTLEIIEYYKNLYPNKIKLYQEDNINLGAGKSFIKLLLASKAKYIMFADQDDIWLENKIEISLKEMVKLERENKTGIIVHSDLKIVDKDLKMKYKSLYRYKNLNPTETRLERIILKNNVTGCTMLINSIVREWIKRYQNEEFIMHDWFLAILVIAKGGKIRFIDEALVLYRQHGNNTIGAYNKKIFKLFKVRKIILATINQASTVSKLVKNKVIDQYALIQTLSKIKKIKKCLELGIRKGNIIEDIIYYLFI